MHLSAQYFSTCDSGAIVGTGVDRYRKDLSGELDNKIEEQSIHILFRMINSIPAVSAFSPMILDERNSFITARASNQDLIGKIIDNNQKKRNVFQPCTESSVITRYPPCNDQRNNNDHGNEVFQRHGHSENPFSTSECF